MDYIVILNTALGLSMTLTLLRFFHSNNSYEKIMCFYLMFTQFILLFLTISKAQFREIFDIIIILFLLKLVAVLFLLFNRKKI
ncbi:MAG: hypothetical protein EBT63_01715 [Proteobacteria bacterium]|nr:hypothetical protein [Pseudomonadota bacterium]NCA28353.1 hypothetical protein [Pseudomonadota bacterium]